MLGELKNLADNVHVRNEHSPAAITSQAEIIKNVFWVFAFLGFLFKSKEQVSNDLPTSPTSYWKIQVNPPSLIKKQH